MTDDGIVVVRRYGKAIPARVVTGLRASDEVRLPLSASATVITPNGVSLLQGPKNFLANVLSTNAGASTTTNVATDPVRTVLFKPAQDLLAAGLLVTTRSGQSIPLYSPIGSTAHLTPLILWKAQPGKTYDLQITDEFNANAAPLRLRAVVPPVDFSKIESWKGRALAAKGLYRLRLSETGEPLTTCEYTFRTASEAERTAGRPAERLLEACKILVSDPSRLGDALANLLTLPADLADTELALRLKLLAFGQLGYKDDFDAAASRLQAGW